LEISLINAYKSHWDFILDLRNEDFSNFYHQEKPLTKEDHYNYLSTQEKNPNFHHWIIIYKSQNIGYVRIKDNDVGIMIQKKFQNKGFATLALNLVEEKARELGIKKLIALVKPENQGSKKIFLKNNFEEKMHWLEKNL
jgi:RimJ/RimL family protein N-acetyltransferase